MPGLLMDWDDDGTHRRVYVDQPEALFGRHGSMDLQTDSIRVGRRQSRFFRDDGAWFVEDTESPSGTYIDEQLVRGRARLQVGQIVRCGGALFLIQDLAYEPAPDDACGALRTDEVFAARGLTAAIGVTIRGTQTTGADRRALTDAIATAHASHDDPVSLVHACAAFETGMPAAIRVHLARVELDVHALAMLRERSAPAKAAWTWLTQRFQYRPLHPEGLVCGLVYKGLPFEPSPAIVDVAPEGGMLIWVREGPLSHLLRLTTTDGIVRAPLATERDPVLLARVFTEAGVTMLRDIGFQKVSRFEVGDVAHVAYHTLQRVR